jgi:hypothetical protein
MMKRSRYGLAAVAAICAGLGVGPAHAQSSKELDQLRDELLQLRKEITELKQQKGAAAPVDASGWGERIEQVEIRQKDAVVLGDVGGGFRLPGSETSLRLYGFAEAHALYDVKSAGANDLFTDLSFQPLRSTEPRKGKTKFTAETSRLGLESATPTGAGTFNTKLEMDFYSYGADNRNRLRLRHAYGEYAGWLIGQTWSTFMDLDNLPETVDFNGPIGSPFSRRTMIRYTYGDAKAGFKFSVAAEDPEDQFGGGSSNERMPQLVARFDKTFDWGAVNVRGLMHEKRSATQTRRGYGLGVGASFKLSDKDLLMGQFARVDGDVDQMYGSNGYSIDPDTGALSFDQNMGLVVGWARTFNDQLRGNLVFGMNRGKTAQAIDNRTLRQLHANLVYSPIKNVEFGGEVVFGQRKTFDNDKGDLLRLDLMGRYSF